MIRYAKQELFVISTRESALITLDTLPVAFKYEKEHLAGTLHLNMNGPTAIDESLFDFIQTIFQHMNIVLDALIPGLNIEIVTLETGLSETGQKRSLIEIVSTKNKKSIPLRYESEGIKKIVSVLNLIIGLYNHPSMTVAIDELDSGIFEYLLGEILKIVSTRAKGQLIFTSHNLRPLETIDHRYVVFTTTDPKNRFVRPTNVRDANNLRDFYYRNIVLGTEEPKLYEETNSASIAFSFLSFQNNTLNHRKKGSVTAAHRLAGSLSQYDDGKSYDEMRYEALKERYGPFDMDHKENFNE